MSDPSVAAVFTSYVGSEVLGKERCELVERDEVDLVAHRHGRDRLDSGIYLRCGKCVAAAAADAGRSDLFAVYERTGSEEVDAGVRVTLSSRSKM